MTFKDAAILVCVAVGCLFLGYVVRGCQSPAVPALPPVVHTEHPVVTPPIHVAVGDTGQIPKPVPNKPKPKPKPVVDSSGHQMDVHWASLTDIQNGDTATAVWLAPGKDNDTTLEIMSLEFRTKPCIQKVDTVYVPGPPTEIEVGGNSFFDDTKWFLAGVGAAATYIVISNQLGGK